MVGALDSWPLVCGSNYRKNLSIFLAMAFSIEDYLIIFGKIRARRVIHF
jgi:hypothetical protein